MLTWKYFEITKYVFTEILSNLQGKMINLCASHSLVFIKTWSKVFVMHVILLVLITFLSGERRSHNHFTLTCIIFPWLLLCCNVYSQIMSCDATLSNCESVIMRSWFDNDQPDYTASSESTEDQDLYGKSWSYYRGYATQGNPYWCGMKTPLASFQLPEGTPYTSLLSG